MIKTDRICLEQIEESDRKTLENLFQFYLYDMSEFALLRVASSGRFRFDPQNLDKYWNKEGSNPYLIKYEGELAGFFISKAIPVGYSSQGYRTVFCNAGPSPARRWAASFEAVLEPSSWQMANKGTSGK